MNRWTTLLLIAVMLGACGPRQGTNTTRILGPGASSPAAGAQGAVEGVIDSGGGRGVLCQKDGQSSEGAQASGSVQGSVQGLVQSLDLFEAREVHGLTMNQDLKSEAEALSFVSKTLADYFWMPDKGLTKEQNRKQVEELLKKSYKEIKFLDLDKTLKLINDSHDVIMQDGCSVVQVAIYYNESSLLINRALWEKMNWTDRAALLMHEAIYFKAREIGARNSIETRKLVGYLFSSEGIRGKAEGLPEDSSKVVKCEFDQSKVISGVSYAYETVRDGQRGVELIFSKIGHIQSVFRLSAFFRGNAIADLTRVGTTLESELLTETYPASTTLKLARGPTDSKFGNAQVTQTKTAKTRSYKFTCK